MKLLVLYTRLSGYTAACLRALRDRSGAEILIYAWPNQKNVPFDTATFGGIDDVRMRTEFSVADIEQSIQTFGPDAVLVSGWTDKGYIKICRKLKSQGIPVISGCDTQWSGSLRQRIASNVAPWHIQKFIDVLWVAGERQRQLASKLGYSGDRCWDGYYACDWDAFTQPQTEVDLVSNMRNFLYVGRYEPEKGLDTLAAAYRVYRHEVQDPWPLICAGSGSLRNLLLEAGAEDRGFLQPVDLPTLMGEAAAFVLPSRIEPWGVVVQEAAASRLPLILSNACGSSVHLLRPYFNGFSFESGSVDGLVSALKSMHVLGPEQRKEYGKASFDLSKQYTPQRWAEVFMIGLSKL